MENFNFDIAPKGKFNAWAEGRKYFLNTGEELLIESDFQDDVDDYSEFLNQDYKPFYHGNDSVGVFAFRLKKDLYAFYTCYPDLNTDVSHGNLSDLQRAINSVQEEIDLQEEIDSLNA